MAVCFLWHFPASRLGLLLAITLLCEVRTFLDSRSRGRPANSSASNTVLAAEFPSQQLAPVCKKRIAAACMVGTAVEFYDSYIYGTGVDRSCGVVSQYVRPTRPPPVILSGWALGLPWLFAVIPLIDTANPVLFTAAIVGTYAIAAFAYAPMPSFVPELFATRYRYTGAGLALNLAGIIRRRCATVDRQPTAHALRRLGHWTHDGPPDPD